MKNNKVLMMILILLVGVIVIAGGTYAYWSWVSANAQKTNITFTVASEYSCSADGGGNITSSDVVLVPTDCTNTTHAIKRTIKTNVTTSNGTSVKMNLWLNIDKISTNLANSDNFKYVLSKNSGNCTSNITSQGTFKGKAAGGKVNLFTNVSYSNGNNDTYYLYIWLDKAETNSNTMNQSFSFSLGGRCIDNNSSN